jgi:hypothetical protein
MLQCTGKVCVPPSSHYQSPANLAKLIRDGHKNMGTSHQRLSIQSLGNVYVLTGPYTCKGKDNLQIDFMALTIIEPASSWFEIAKLPIVEQLHQQTATRKELLIADKIFDKTSECTAKLVHKTWLCIYPRCCRLIYDNRSKFKLHFEYLCESYGIKRKPTTVKNP